MHGRYFILLAGVCSTAVTGSLHAQTTATQDDGAAQTEDAPGSFGGDIVVTAQRREESLQRVPVAVSVVGGEAIIERAITTQSDLQTAVPGLTVRASADSNQLNYAIRGQSLDAFSATRPGVLPYVNEVQVGGGGASAFYDLGSIQVLKGPQGTLFGRNATGGAVLFSTAKPTDRFEGYAVARAGNYDSVHLEGAVNIPLSEDMFMLRVAGVHDYRKGFQRNLHPFCDRPRPLFPIANDPAPSNIRSEVDHSCRIGTVDRTGGRASLTISPGSAFTNDLVVDYLEAGGSSATGVLYSLNPTGAIPTPLLTDVSPSGAPTMEAIIGAFTGNPALGVGAAAAYRNAAPFLPQGGLVEFLALQQARGPYDVTIDGLNEYDARNWVVTNITSLDLSDTLTLRNIIGYTNLRSTTFNDIDGSPFGIDNNGFFESAADGPLGRRDKIRQFSEELQLVGETSNLDYVVGVYYSDEKSRNLTSSDLFDFPFIRSIQINTSITRNETFAGYAQGTYDLGDMLVEGLSLRAGLRYTDETISLQILPRDISFNDPPAVQATYEPFQEKSFGTLSYTLGVDYQVTPDLLVYASHRRSSRHGGFNNVVRPVPGLGTEGGNGYATEFVSDVELGLKVQERFGVPYRFNLAVYQNWIEDAQRVAYTISNGSPAAITVNVPKARVRGFEIDGQVEPTDWLMVGGQVNYTDAEFTDNLVSVLGGAPVVFGTYPDVAEWSGAAFVSVEAPVSNDLTANLRGDVYAQSKTFFSSTANLNPGAELPGYALVNLRVGLKSETGGWSIAGLVKNLFEETYYVGGVALGELFQTNSAVPGEPRTWQVELRFEF